MTKAEFSTLCSILAFGGTLYIRNPELSNLHNFLEEHPENLCKWHLLSIWFYPQARISYMIWCRLLLTVNLLLKS